VIYSLAFLPDGRLVSGGADKTVIVWDVKKGNPLRPVLELPPPAERGQVVYVFATPAGGIFSASRGWDLDVWEPRHSKPLFHRKGYVTPPGGPVFAIVSRGTTYYTRMTLSPDGKMLAGVDGNDVEVYDVSPYAMPAR